MPFVHRYGKYLALLLLLAFSFLLVWYRWHLTDRRIFFFFWWNLWLAMVPWLSSEAMGRGSNIWRLLLLGGLSVLFLPNAPYMITDLFHLRARAEFPLWYDTMLVFWFALIGIVLFYLTVFNIRAAIQHWMATWLVEAGIGLLCLLNGFGIYLGRYLRFNSWDLWSNPDNLAEEILERLINPSASTRTVGVTLLYGLSMWVGYWMIRLYRMGEGKKG
jgi:uncharacterized membrane protein